MHSFEIKSDLAIEPSEFWSTASLKSVNWELAPIARMTAPNEWAERGIESWEVGVDLFKSWILLCGLLPVDRHSFRFREIVRGAGFRECSSSWMNREWNHDRTIVAREPGCTLIDQVTFVSRIPILAPLLLPLYRLVFRHRHRRLKKRYGPNSAERRG